MKRGFFFFYSILSGLLYILALPFFFLFSFKQKYHESIPARFFGWKNPRLAPAGVWFHVCSFGEARAIKPLVDKLDKDILRMTATTHTGVEAVKAYTDQSRYLAYESLLFFWLRPQKVLLVMEAEFWYLLFTLAKARGAKTMLINARMSERSYPKYQRVSWLYKQIFKSIDEVYAQTSQDKERLESLGASNVKVIGNIKLSYLPQPTKVLTKPKALLVCAASTHEGEEQGILDAFIALKKESKEAKLLLVPRHPERFDKVSKMVEKSANIANLTWQRYSQHSDLQGDIICVDCLGELVNLYAISDIVILGGAFEPIGGHNAAEAAQFACKIISGKHYFNQKDIFEAIEGITIVERYNLSRRLSQHALLKQTKIKHRSDISPILESIQAVL